MASRLYRITQLNPNYPSFVSGVTVAVAVNLITAVAVSDIEKADDYRIVLSSLVFFLSSLTWIALAWSLEEPFNKWKTIPRNIGWDEDDILTRVIFKRPPYAYWALLILGLSLIIGGCALLFV